MNGEDVCIWEDLLQVSILIGTDSSQDGGLAQKWIPEVRAL